MRAESQDDREDQLLRLQRMETKLVQGLFEHPGVVARSREHQLRYAISLASLEVFQPGAARRNGRSKHADVRVRTQRLSRWRSLILDELGPILLKTEDTKERVEEASVFLGPRLARMAKTRAEVVEKYADDFSVRHLDQEMGIKTLVSIAGGGGGSGFVYIGAWDVLQASGIVPGYVIGASMGSVLGLFRARDKVGDFDAYLRLAKNMSSEELFRFVSLRTRFGFPGMARLFLDAGIGKAFRRDDGETMRVCDMEIPYDAVVAGVRRGALDEDPEQYAVSHHLHEDKRPRPLQMRAQIAAQLVRLAGFINPRVVKEIVIGRDAETQEFNAIDAAGFSAAIPGLLHYDMTRDDPRMEALLTQLMERNDVVALVDGGVANNVPSGPAWRQVQDAASARAMPTISLSIHFILKVASVISGFSRLRVWSPCKSPLMIVMPIAASSSNRPFRQSGCSPRQSISTKRWVGGARRWRPNFRCCRNSLSVFDGWRQLNRTLSEVSRAKLRRVLFGGE